MRIQVGMSRIRFQGYNMAIYACGKVLLWCAAIALLQDRAISIPYNTYIIIYIYTK